MLFIVLTHINQKQKTFKLFLIFPTKSIPVPDNYDHQPLETDISTFKV
jgi:hypothetical protein